MERCSKFNRVMRWREISHRGHFPYAVTSAWLIRRRTLRMTRGRMGLTPMLRRQSARARNLMAPLRNGHVRIRKKLDLREIVNFVDIINSSHGIAPANSRSMKTMCRVQSACPRRVGLRIMLFPQRGGRTVDWNAISSVKRIRGICLRLLRPLALRMRTLFLWIWRQRASRESHSMNFERWTRMAIAGGAKPARRKPRVANGGARRT